MAYRRTITSRAKLFYQHPNRVAPSFSQTHRDDSDSREKSIPRSPEPSNYFQHRFFGTVRSSFGTFPWPRNACGERRFAIPAGCGVVSCRNFSSGGSAGVGAADKIEILNGEILNDMVGVLGEKAGEGAADKIGILNDEILNDVAGVLGEKAVEAAPVLNEVAVAAADSFFPVAALQYLIDYVHVYTGLDWWAAIVLTTVLVRALQLPLLINQLKSTSKFTLLRPKLEAIKEEMQDQDMNPNAVADGQARMQKLFKEYGVTPFTPLKGILISGPIFTSFFFAIHNMAEKVPSFKQGGIFWFTDLSTPDTMYIFPVMAALSFWITVECNAQEGMEGNPAGNKIKNVCRVFAALTIPFSASFPKAVFCYWITSSLFSLGYGLVLRNPEVKRILKIPIIPVTPPSINQKPGLSFFETLKKYAAAQQHQQQQLQSSSSSSSPSPAEVSSKPTNQGVAQTSTLNQRIKSLEKEVKGRKKGKRR